MTEILMLAYDYLDQLKASDEYHEYLILSKVIDDKYHDEVLKVNEIKEMFDEVSEYGKYHPEYKNISEKFSNAKKELFSYQDIKRYLELNRMLEERINDLLREVSFNISENIPVFNKFGFITSKGGGCSVR
ncbi:MAG: YlbF family regulator [Acholeplasma sp.]|nr:YlbF family regulator [Acholeplasma sp.]